MIKTVPPKSIRHLIYCLALINYKRIKGQVGLCFVLRNAMESLGIEYYYESPYTSIEQYPELKKYKSYQPKWFPYSDTKIRIEILEKAILLTTPK